MSFLDDVKADFGKLLAKAEVLFAKGEKLSRAELEATLAEVKAKALVVVETDAPEVKAGAEKAVQALLDGLLAALESRLV